MFSGFFYLKILQVIIHFLCTNTYTLLKILQTFVTRTFLYCPNNGNNVVIIKIIIKWTN